MKYFHLVWAALFRRKTRTFLTLASIMAAFLLFGLLDGIRSSFAQLGQNADGAQRLQTASKLSFIENPAASLRRGSWPSTNIERSPTPTGSAAPTRDRATLFTLPWPPTTWTSIPRW